ncbi:MAG: 50S ribosomal protein L30 [Acidobacteriota bacterium]|nr:50S ribosomal protein L30 [Blastocatellia bacterium]MDW8241021.1 50S ribosomal protein L30 [Acidobacteriota bacterium]
MTKAKQSGQSTGTIKIQYYRSVINRPAAHKRIVRSLGLTKLNQIVERPDTPGIRGMVAKVPHLLRIVEESSRQDVA